MGKIQLLLEKYFPDPTERRKYLEEFAESIRYAHKIAPGRWCVTTYNGNTYPSRLRLILGQLMVSAVHEGGLWVSCLSDVLSQPEKDFVLQGKPPQSAYQSIPGSICGYIPASKLPEITANIKKGQQELFQKAAKTSTKPHNISQKSHDPEILIYLRQLLSQPIPDPTWHTNPPLNCLSTRHFKKKTSPFQQR